MEQPQPQLVNAPTEPAWPDAACKRGLVYSSTSPYLNEDGSVHEIVVMDMRSWVDFGTMQESLRQVARKQDARIKELMGVVASRDIALADVTNRLENLREARRNEKRADIEGGALVLPGSSSFNTGKKS